MTCSLQGRLGSFGKNPAAGERVCSLAPASIPGGPQICKYSSNEEVREPAGVYFSVWRKKTVHFSFVSELGPLFSSDLNKLA